MIRMWTCWLQAVAVVLLTVGCGGTSSDPAAESTAWQAGDSTYVFDEPDDAFVLDKELEEISGLTVLENGMLAAVQDEKGDLYLLDRSSGEIAERRDFGGSGDYEGIELGGGRLYILRSDGRVFAFDDWSGPELSGDTEDLDLPKGCDAEGIAYQTTQRRLLISCKERGGKKLGRKKAIYAYDPDAKSLTAEPVYILDVEAFEASVQDHPINDAVRSVVSERMDLSGFKPSGLAVHPRTGDIYVLSSVTKVVIRMSEAGDVTALWALPPERFDQPEGIAIAPSGDLFISNEAGDRKRATLLRFRSRSAAESQPSSNE